MGGEGVKAMRQGNGDDGGCNAIMEAMEARQGAGAIGQGIGDKAPLPCPHAPIGQLLMHPLPSCNKSWPMGAWGQGNGWVVKE
jgi:hypothetical protein